MILYHDDIEVGNALGLQAGVHKLTMFYVAVEGFTDGKLSSIHLSIVCHASDLERFGYGPIMRPLIADLEMLYGGVEVTLENGTECVIHAKLEHLSADNLAANQILGMNRSFSKGHYCRFCYANADLCAVMVSPDHCLCRSPAGYLKDVQAASVNPGNSKQTGVREKSALSDISYFSVIDATVPDIT